MVKADRPDLEDQKAALTRQQNEYKILLKVSPSHFLIHGKKESSIIFLFRGLEDDLLQRLSAAGDDILR